MSNEAFNQAFSKNLNRYMKKFHLNQRELADRLGVGTAAVSFWCNGVKAPRMDKVDKLCELFHCRRSDLIEEDPSAGGSDTFTDLEIEIIDRYRKADYGMQISVQRILGIPEKPFQKELSEKADA